MNNIVSLNEWYENVNRIEIFMANRELINQVCEVHMLLLCEYVQILCSLYIAHLLGQLHKFVNLIMLEFYTHCLSFILFYFLGKIEA